MVRLKTTVSGLMSQLDAGQWTGIMSEPLYQVAYIKCGKVLQKFEFFASRSNVKHGVFMLRNIKKYLDETIKEKTINAFNQLLEQTAEGIRFAEWYGMHSEGLMKQYGLTVKII